ncbi:hypothetical protein GJE02_12655 [Mycobacterium intracellulare subsp. chimaera]|nr:hypothetical protein [Mycobacterium intracellulare subsp. chimaera]QGK51646.1 hypothetical protein GJE02_12655 [Mycobacterium intracellulare subsp. chimaera]
MIGAAADPTASIPQPAPEAPSLAWADDLGEPTTQSPQAADVDGDEPVVQSWGATINYAVFLIVCGLIAAAGTAALAWWGMSQP